MKEYSLKEVYKITRYVNYFEEKRKIEKVGKSEKNCENSVEKK